MGIGTAGTHLRCNPNGFHDLFRGRSIPSCRLGMAADAVRTLRHLGNSHGDELLGLAGECSFPKHRSAELLERLLHLRGEIAPSLSEIPWSIADTIQALTTPSPVIDEPPLPAFLAKLLAGLSVTLLSGGSVKEIRKRRIFALCIGITDISGC
jgi:hypothetical protein